MPTYPIAELLDQNVLRVLQQLTLSGSGYQTRLSSVEMWNSKPGNIPQDYKAVVWGGDDEIVDDANTPEQDTAWIRHYGIMVYRFQAEPTPGSAQSPNYLRQLNIIRADIEKVLLAEIKNSTNFGGYGQNCWAKSALYPDDPNDANGVLINIDISYWTNQFDPYQAG